MASYYFLFYATATMKPVQISILNGVAFGGGFGISINGSIRIATEKTQLSMPEAKIGYFTDAAAGYFFQKITNNLSLSLYLALTGHKLIGKEAL